MLSVWNSFIHRGLTVYSCMGALYKCGLMPFPTRSEIPEGGGWRGGNEGLTVAYVEQAPCQITRKQPGVVLRWVNVERKPQDKHGQLACLETHIPGTQDSNALDSK